VVDVTVLDISGSRVAGFQKAAKQVLLAGGLRYVLAINHRLISFLLAVQLLWQLAPRPPRGNRCNQSTRQPMAPNL